MRRLHDRPPARARSALQSRPLQHWPQFPAPIPRRSVPAKSPSRPSAPHAGKRRGALSKFSRLASLSSRLPGSARQRVPAVTTFLARAQEQQPRSPSRWYPEQRD